ncbi:hypothetical protein K435DRAFT_933905 [Dendrothele bispora CBS 962.96]|uniref:Family A G protein-coupled receptor-like protein n=1 Tax=Dendrothele bispora (strain CBS 962.96) TaxID=1314807 RepID=A0A4V4HC90_DENBC|nr:hypothetical protein K435DRAFT_933905 [Dendrothele bispora CBS 962.96]
MPSRATESPLSDFDIFNLTFGIFQTAVGFLFFGVYCTLFIATILIFMTGKLSLSKVQVGSLAVTILTLFLSTTSLVLNMISNLPPFSLLQLDPPNRKHYNVVIATTIMNRLNYLLSDGIVIWRAWILCPSNSLVKLAMGICMILSCIGTFLDTGLTAKKFLRNPENFGAQTKILFMVVPLLVTNLGATSVIIYKMIQSTEISVTSNPVRFGLCNYLVTDYIYGIDPAKWQEKRSIPNFCFGHATNISSQNQRSYRSHQQPESTEEEEETGTLGLVSGSAIRQ